MAHVPVLLNEVIELLSPRPGENFIDGTCGGAGHTKEILRHIEPEGKILCLDLDERALVRVQEAFKKEKEEGRLILVHDNFANLAAVVRTNNFSQPNGILLDLGLSSDQLDSPPPEADASGGGESGRGFSFLKDEPLDMRFSASGSLTAREIVNLWPEADIARIIKDFGEERFSDRIAGEIVKSRKIKPIISTKQLVETIGRVIPEKYKHDRTNFATRTFQALRIAVNDELANLEKFLPGAVNVLKPGGRLAVISFHSLEDRIVKNYFRQKVKEGEVKILTKKPVRPTASEIAVNPRSRSAKLRALIKN